MRVMKRKDSEWLQHANRNIRRAAPQTVRTQPTIGRGRRRVPGDPYVNGANARAAGAAADENPYAAGEYRDLWNLGFSGE